MTTGLPTDAPIEAEVRDIDADDEPSHRSAHLFDSDPQFEAAIPRRDVLDAARRPGLRLSQVLQTLAEGYSDRPALGSRVLEIVRDEASSAQRHATPASLHHHFLWRTLVQCAGRGQCVAPRFACAHQTG